jgi:hypothetical protein
MSRDGKDDAFRQHAQICLELAQKTDDSESKAALIDMAHSWHALAETHEKNSQTTLVYEPQRGVSARDVP